MTIKQKLRYIYIISDIISLSASYIAINLISDNCLLSLSKGIMFYCIFLLVFALSGYYNEPFSKSRVRELVTTMLSILISVAIYVIVCPIYIPNILIDCSIVLITTYLVRLSVTTCEWYRGQKSGEKENVFLIYNGKVGEDTKQWIKKQPNKNIINDINCDIITPEVITKIKSINTGLHEIVIAVDNINVLSLDNLISHVLHHNIKIFLSARSIIGLGRKNTVVTLYGEPLINLLSTNMSESEESIKWFFDKIVSTVLLIILSPVFIILAIIVRLDSSGPAIYTQERIGRKGRAFTIYKFRTMRMNAEEVSPKLSMPNDNRITRVGRWMRRYRLDELPQLYNVIKGDMSIVGPRPERNFYINQIVKICPNYRLLYNIKPGITSWGIVKYGYAYNIEQMVERFAYDWIYYENRSILLDLYVLAYTIRTLILGLGK